MGIIDKHITTKHMKPNTVWLFSAIYVRNSINFYGTYYKSGMTSFACGCVDSGTKGTTQTRRPNAWKNIQMEADGGDTEPVNEHIKTLNPCIDERAAQSIETPRVKISETHILMSVEQTSYRAARNEKDLISRWWFATLTSRLCWLNIGQTRWNHLRVFTHKQHYGWW